VGLRHITLAHHRGIVLRPRVCAVCYIFLSVDHPPAG
jgi:hypothetical protein